MPASSFLYTILEVSLTISNRFIFRVLISRSPGSLPFSHLPRTGPFVVPVFLIPPAPYNRSRCTEVPVTPFRTLAPMVPSAWIHDEKGQCRGRRPPDPPGTARFPGHNGVRRLSIRFPSRLLLAPSSASNNGPRETGTSVQKPPLDMNIEDGHKLDRTSPPHRRAI